MVRFALACLAAAALAWTAPASAAIYAWKDADGATNYTNDLDNVPRAYRDGVTTVVRESPHAADRAADRVVEPAAPPGAPVEAAAPAADSAASAAAIDAAYWAGVHSAADAPVIPFPAAPPVVQNVQIINNSPPPVGFAPLFAVPAFVRPPHAFHPRRPFVPARGPFLQGPAGPPPLGAAGPPPVNFQPGMR